MIRIVWKQIEELAETLKQIKIQTDPFTDPELYPPTNDNTEDILRYFLTMVAIDHRTQIPGQTTFTSKIGNKEYSGATLLYKLGKTMYDKNKNFFTPENLTNITKTDIEKWLTSDTGTIRDPETRAQLLRDLGWKLIKIYDGKTENLIQQSNQKLKNEEGLIEKLKIFKAYQDPVEKKPYLLAKFLIRRNIFKPKDPQNMQLPIDNHLTRIAARTGIIETDDPAIFTNQRETTYEEDIIIRLQTRRAYKTLSQLSNQPPDKLDDYLWTHGKNTCTYQNPKCNTCQLQNTCQAYKNPEKQKLQEHKYINTWYY
ncbi:MAG: queuosine salvage family protein [Thermoprotei archaeon]